MNNEKIRVYFDSVKYKEKPSDMPRISNNITKHLQELTITEIALKLASGQTILPAEMSGKRSKANFKQTSLILLDFDNNSENYLSIEDVLNNPFVKKYASFLYHTFSSTETKHKFRLAFVLDKPITNNAHYEYMYEYLLKKFPEADSACKDSSRVFFGGKNPILINKNNKLKVLAPSKTHLKATREVLEPTGLIVPPTNYTANRGVISLFKSNNVEGLKQHIQDNNLALNITVCSVTEGLREVCKVDMYKLLGLEYINPFQCIISEDNNPSASIFKNAKGVFIYNRFSEDKDKQYVFNNVQMIKILTKKPIIETMNYLFKLLCVRVKYPKEILNQELKIFQFMSDLENTDLKSNYPNTHKILGRDKHLIIDLLQHFINNKLEYTDSDNNIIIEFIHKLGVRAITKDLFNQITDYKLEKMKKKISTLTYIGILKKLENFEIPKSLLEEVLEYKFSNRHGNRKNFLKLEINNLNLEFIELKCKELVDMGYREVNFKSDFLTINGDLNDRDRVFNQNKDKKITEKTANFLDEMINYIDLNFKSNQYIFEKELKQYLNTKYSKSFIVDNYSICITSALNRTNTMKIKTNNKIKDLYGINGLSSMQRPTIIVKNPSI